MKKILLLILSILSFSANAQRYLPLWNPAQPAPDDNRITTPETTHPNGNISNITQPGIHVYLPSSPKNADSSHRPPERQTPAVLICPGGGYGVVAIQHEGHAYAQFLAAHGIAGIVLKYRLPNGIHTVPLTDARRAMEIIRDSARKWHIDPREIGVSGFSAGGHLASTLSAHPGKTALRPAFQILFYPVVTFTDSTIRHTGSRWGLTGGNPSFDSYYSAERNVCKQTPPALIFVSDDDTGVLPANSYNLRDSLLIQGVPARVVSFPYGGHGWGFSDRFDRLPQVKRQTLEFIRTRQK